MNLAPRVWISVEKHSTTYFYKNKITEPRNVDGVCGRTAQKMLNFEKPDTKPVNI